jgi:chromate transporter
LDGPEQPRDPGGSGDEPRTVTLRQALPVWTAIALNSFGGPAGQIAVMHTALVDRERWISERRFLHALNYCMLLPGPEAQQLSVYIGWLLHGIRGGLIAGILFVLPGFLAILGLSLLYTLNQDTTWVQALFYGLKPAVLAVVAAAVLRVGRRAIHGRLAIAITIGSYLAFSMLGIPFPIVIIGAGLIGVIAGRMGISLSPGGAGSGGHGPAASANDATAASGPRPIIHDDGDDETRPSTRRTMIAVLVGIVLWLGPVLALVALFGPTNVFATQAVFFSGAAVVTFGGAYAVLTYVAQQVVEVLHWLTPLEMLDGLAMAETTPGPLIMVVEFVGFLAAFRNPGGLDPVLAGVLGAILVTWVTFVPSFLWIFVGAPYAESLRRSPRLSAALAAITAAVVGAILNLAIWFGLHALFETVNEVQAGPLTLTVPDPSTLDPAALAIAIGAAYLTFGRKWPMLGVLALAAVVGAAWYLVRP